MAIDSKKNFPPASTQPGSARQDTKDHLEFIARAIEMADPYQPMDLIVLTDIKHRMERILTEEGEIKDIYRWAAKPLTYPTTTEEIKKAGRILLLASPVLLPGFAYAAYVFATETLRNNPTALRLAIVTTVIGIIASIQTARVILMTRKIERSRREDRVERNNDFDRSLSGIKNLEKIRELLQMVNEKLADPSASPSQSPTRHDKPPCILGRLIGSDVWFGGAFPV